MNAELSYFIQEGVLVGKVGERPFHILALSGGGGGSTQSRPAASTNNPYMETFKTVEGRKNMPHAHGGPIPPGRYRIQVVVTRLRRPLLTVTRTSPTFAVE